MLDESKACHKWLGIPPEEYPPNHYRLLSLRLFESDREVIRNACDERLNHLRAFATGEDGLVATELMNKVTADMICLRDADKKKAYDAKLRASPGLSSPDELEAAAKESPQTFDGPSAQADVPPPIPEVSSTPPDAQVLQPFWVLPAVGPLEDPFQVVCPHCQESIEFELAKCGQVLSCAFCNGRYETPPLAELQAAAAEPPPEEEETEVPEQFRLNIDTRRDSVISQDRRRRRTATHKRRMPVLIALFVVGSIVGLIVSFFILKALDPKNWIVLAVLNLVGPDPDLAPGLVARFYKGSDFQHHAVTRIDLQMDWNWGPDAPAPGIPPDYFSICWEGFLKAPKPGWYTLILPPLPPIKGGGRGSCVALRLENPLERGQRRTNDGRRELDVKLSDRPYPIRIQYSHTTGDAKISLWWAQRDGFYEQVVPAVAFWHDRSKGRRKNNLAAIRTTIPIGRKRKDGNRPDLD